MFIAVAEAEAVAVKLKAEVVVAIVKVIVCNWSSRSSINGSSRSHVLRETNKDHINFNFS